ncbi:RNA-directed DNA polymerase [Arthrobacter agilis]|uniref:reverse transcriptase family protein n=1 Tax=Arthrobacter agilis TaxID=37921 RepID=UPI000CE321FA|nr:reverse transcriptase family protein [Arthrobacter agilis]PPB45976.1 RNA-directed DNA polymerase [Arthrobacter agilis]TPV25514.1 RNA-directed DNA polymerase [Arthrobacter agilis]VDR33270.1 Retron-type reverse transcriptase [Arthrobacter agilis]
MVSDERGHHRGSDGAPGAPGRPALISRATAPTSAASRALARTPDPGTAGLALLLAEAFLEASAWQREELVRVGAELLGARRRWLGPLLRGVLGGYPRRPGGAPRELARWIEAQPVFVEAVSTARAAGRPIVPVRYLVGERDGPRTPEDPEASEAECRDLAWLARELGLPPGELEWFADTRHWNRRAGLLLQHYRYVWRSRPGRVPRLLEVPGIRLRTVQRRVLDRHLLPIPLHPAAHGFVPGRSARSGATLHTGSAVVITLDLVSFFARVTPGRVFGVFRQAGYPEATAHVLTGLCTHSVPEAVLRAMPDGGTAEERFGLTQALRAPHLPQGAPSSPALANLAVRRLDARLTGWAEAAGGVYTRYADDLAFSGPAELARRADAFVRGADRIVTAEGHAVNPRKTRVRGSSVRQSVTGIVVNARPNVARTEYEVLKAILHNCTLHGPESQSRGQGDFRSHLAGRIAWVSSLNALRGKKLRDAFERISW